MYRKIIYIVKSDLAFYPPCMSQIRMIHDLGVDIEVWFGSSKDTAKEILEKEGIPYIELVDPRLPNGRLVNTAYNWVLFRKALFSRLRSSWKSDYLLWFGTAETAMPMLGGLGRYPYVLSALELYDDQPTKAKLLATLCKGAEAVTACEISRAYIMKTQWKLDRLPFVFPNKPYNLNLIKNMPLSCDETKKIASILEGKKAILYQGLFQRPQYVAPIAEALALLDSDYAFVLMGKDRYGTVEAMQQIYNNTLYFEFVPSPKHLEITSRAYIGVVLYDDTSLNKAFCAPNKIYEYSAFGIPMLANRLPGLVNTVEANSAGVCVDFTSSEILNAIKEIESNYNQYSMRSSQFYARTDNSKVMSKMLDALGINYGRLA